MKRWIAGLSALVVLAGGATGAAMALAQGGPSLTLYEGEGYGGQSKRIDRAVRDLNSVRFNDMARSLVAEGRWEVCLDAAFRGQCRIVQGQVSDMGDWNGSISSVRYLGPADWGAAGGSAVGGGSTVAATQGQQVPAAQPQEEWRPMQRTDLFGSDYHEFDLNSGQDWRACKSACDADGRCQSWTMTIPGSTLYGRCYLKNTVPTPTEAECCISGIKGAPSAGGPGAGGQAASGGYAGAQGSSRGPNAAETAAQRAARVAAEEAERRTHDRIREGIGRIF
ncbi:MAG TPA: PAN domain-containing protein [Brevundimonas sp.]|uniref:PAN domain-containing protein n=1 Tax=Brevundimonas sp. TaxID=1871086 RepID=UPI0026108C50|nr:PAN domain-containing protein [Brevundimonas sp.]HRO32117.1 PAN domain-containing protein [Brevundimonas sp.]